MIMIKPITNLFPQPCKSAGSLNSGKQPVSSTKKVISVLSARQAVGEDDLVLERRVAIRVVAPWIAAVRVVGVSEIESKVGEVLKSSIYGLSDQRKRIEKLLSNSEGKVELDSKEMALLRNEIKKHLP
jgi:hypothetical protein